MPTRNSQAEWEGDLKSGHGEIRLPNGAYRGPYSFGSRFESGTGTNPEELIAAAHSGCFSMALAHAPAQSGHPARRVKTTAKVHLEKSGDGFAIPRIELITEASVPGIDDVEFRRIAEHSKQKCPVSRLLASATITLDAKLVA